MRCPYCGGLNSDQASFCAVCGRDLKPVVQSNIHQRPAQSPAQSPFQPPRQPSVQPPYQPPRQAPQPATRQAVQPNTGTIIPAAPPAPQAPQAPEPPTQFPPRTIEQLKALEVGALPYTLAHDAVGDGRKKIVQIVYRPCTPWQQVATLLKAFHEQKNDRFDTILIQGVPEQGTNIYNFTNGQLRFDRNVRLGSQTINRYQIETGSSFENDSVRIVLSE